ncbi:XRE family transcriptional regulator [Desulfatiglans anilini]|uniref:XRE family transcriptional regulator n=1 Tax=Desulfatiglans anilini TaxID=90728 RepID=UPI000487BF6F|nr:XRE family transcriptional regulator [Desulfatiglans anilini]
MDFGDRIKAVRGELSQKEFAEKLSVNITSVQRYEQGAIPKGDVLQKIRDIFRINIDWLLSGEGPEWLEPESRHGVDFDVDLFSFIPRAEARLSAGNGSVVLSENFDKKLAFRNDWLHKVATCKENLVLMFVRGDSMHPTLQDWDLVMVDRGRTKPRSGHIFAINIGDDLLQIKRLFFIPPDKIRIVSDQGGIYPPYELNLSEMRIIGQVIWFARELPTE